MTTNTNILIIGATGKTGIPVVEQALQAGFHVRAVIRREDHRSEQLRLDGAETVIGDVHDLQSVRRLVEGIDRIYFTYPPHLEHLVEATANVAIAARDAGVSALVNMSQLPTRENARSALTRQHWLSENLFDLAGIGAIHIRPTYFMENLLLFSAQTIAEQGRIFLPYGNRGHAPIAAQDIARVVIHLLQHPESHVGKKPVLTGPELFTIQDMANVIGQQLGHEVTYVDLPSEQWHTILTEQVGLPAFLANHLHQVAIDHQEGVFEHQSDAVERLTGIAPQSLESFVREHLPQFQGKENVFLGV